MSLRKLREDECSARQAWRSSLDALTQVEEERLGDGDGRGDGGQGLGAWRENLAVAQANEQRYSRNYQYARKRRIDEELRIVKVFSAVVGIVVSLGTILQTIVECWTALK